MWDFLLHWGCPEHFWRLQNGLTKTARLPKWFGLNVPVSKTTRVQYHTFDASWIIFVLRLKRSISLRTCLFSRESSPRTLTAMSTQKFVLGIDGGTESIRASVFDLEGNQISCFSSAYETFYPESSWAEQHAQDWVEVRKVSLVSSMLRAL